MVSGKIEVWKSKPIFDTLLEILASEKISFSELKKKLRVKDQTLSNRLAALNNTELIASERNTEAGRQRGRFYSLNHEKVLSNMLPLSREDKKVFLEATKNVGGTKILVNRQIRETIESLEEMKKYAPISVSNLSDFFGYAKIIYVVQERALKQQVERKREAEAYWKEKGSRVG